MLPSLRPAKRLLFAAPVLVLIAASIGWCQVSNMADTTSTPVPGAGHNYFGVLNETVNPANGSVSVRIALPMPPGRKLTVPFYVTYDSNGTLVLNPSAAGISWTGAQGWAYSGPTLTVATQDVKLPNGQGSTCRVSLNYVYSDPSGARHPLYLSIYGYAPGGNRGGNCTTAVMPDNIPVDNPQDTNGGDPLLRASTTGIASGGDFFVNPVSVADADGTVVTFTPAAVTGGTFVANSIEDRNGNVITVNSVPSAKYLFAGYTDTLDRSALSISYGHTYSTTGTDTITVSGLGAPYYAGWYGSATVTNNTLGVNQYSGSCVVAGVNLTFPTLSGFTLPNGESYQFSYDPTYGALNKIVYPTGGYVRYVWGVNAQSQAGFTNGTLPTGQPFGCEYHYDTPVITDRYVSFDGSTEALHQHFAYSTVWQTGLSAGLYSSKTTTVTTYDTLRGENFSTTYTYSGTLVPTQPNTDVAITNEIPLEYSIAYNDWGGTLLRTVYKNWASQYTMSCESTTQGGMTSRIDYAYSTYGAQVTDKKEWDWGQAPDCRTASSGNPLRETKTTYDNITTAIFTAGPSVFDRPATVMVYYGGNKNAETDYTYDNGVSSVTATQHDNTNYPASNTVRGNAASKTAKCFQSCANAVTSYTYDQTGQMTSMTDPRTNVTSYCYGDQSPGCSSSTTNAYLTQITHPNTGVAHIEKFGYNLASGEVTSAIDENNQTTSYLYNDSLARLTETDYPDGGKTTIAYNDSPPSPSVTTSKFLGGSSWATTAVIMDGLGHATETQMQSDPAGIDYTDTTYDALGRVWKVSNPYRSVSERSYGVTTYSYDVLGRPSDESGASSILRPDGSTVSTTYSANCVTVTDEQIRRRPTCSDGIGRLLSVVEDPNGFNYPTSYTYTYPVSNSYGMVFSVNQGSQTRTFTYDSLSRLTSAANPESGTTSYTYDADGNVLTKRDARGESVTYGPYDPLNRLEKKAYPDGTTANFSYDESSVRLGSWASPPLAFPVGRLTHTATQKSGGSMQTATVQDYDPMGRVKDYWQCTPANCGSSSIWDMNYTYGPAGDVTSWLHPAGYTLTNTINAAQQITAVQSSWVDSTHPQYLAESISYTPWGALSTLVNGCAGSGCANAQETYTYNNRLEPVVIELGTTGNATADYCLVYNYSLGAANPTSCLPPSVAAGNNGNVVGYWYEDNMNSSFSHTASYTYDGVNRLSTAAATGNSAYNLTYSYDRYGNMTCVMNGQTAGPCPQLSYNTATNQLTSSGYTYDAAGNLTKDSSNPTAHTYQWDGEERAASVDSGPTWSFTYNALGDRAQWGYTGGADQHLFDPAGTWLGNAGSYSLVPFGGRYLALYLGGNTLFNHVNALDSASMRTLQSGAEAEDILFYPWGDVWEVQGSGGYNFANIPYRDVTTTTDITTARFSSPNLGRWFTPDPAGKGAVRLDDPQTWNMYAYVRNNPTTLTDPSGLLMLPLMSWAGPSGVPPGCGFPCVDVGYEEENGGEPPPPNPPASEKPPEQKDTQHVIVPDPQSERTGSYMGKAFKEQEVIYQTFKVDDKGSPTSTDKKTDFELREKIVAGSKDVWTCGTAGSCRSEGGAFGDQQRVFKGESYDVEKRFTIDGKSAQVYDPGTKKSYDYVVVHSTYEGGFQFKFLNDPR